MYIKYIPLERTMNHQKYSYEYCIFQHWILIHTIILLEQDVCHYLCNEHMQCVSWCKIIVANSSRCKIIPSINER
jgi:hypothetical protein